MGLPSQILSICYLMASSLIFLILILAIILLFSWWVLPSFANRKLRGNGFSGPKPSFPLGNLDQMKIQSKNIDYSCIKSSSSSIVSNDIHSTAFPYFAQWQKLHGKVFVYWLGTEPFVYIADPEFLKQMSADIKGKSWGKPNVFKNDRKALFGNGLVALDGEDWVRHRKVISPAFSPNNLKAMRNLIVESVTSFLDRWAGLIDLGHPEIEVEKEIISMSAEITAKTSLGMSNENGRKVLEKLRELQITLFKSNRFVGVPFGKFLNLKHTLKAMKLGKEIDQLFLSIIMERHRKPPAENTEQDLLAFLLTDNEKKMALNTEELVDECKSFFFSGYETTGLALIWTLLLLAVHPEWQNQLREEIRQVIGDEGKKIDTTMLVGLKKMGWVLNEVLRLYTPVPDVIRQASQDIRVDNYLIPNGTNIWIDIVSMNHDPHLWGKDVNEFKPERFKNDIFGECNHKMGFLPFGFGGRMCIGRNLMNMEYKIILTLILSKFSFALSPNYIHFPSMALSVRPTHGLPLIFKPLEYSIV